MIMWLRTTAMQAQKRAMQATAQANSYSLALATTPPIPEIEQNHVTNAVLNATNFLGINTVPIAVNEFDYFVRMWNQAAGVMTAYQAETSLNLLFEPIMPMKPIVMPGIGAATAGTNVAQATARAPMGALRNATVEMVSAHAHLQSAALHGGRAAAQGKHTAERAGGQAKQADNATQQSPDDAAGDAAGCADGHPDGVAVGLGAAAVRAAGLERRSSRSRSRCSR